MPSRRLRWLLGLAGIALGLGAAMGARLAAQQQPVFKSGVELIAVDAAVVDKNGNPIAGLRPDQFDVTIDGKPRRVVSADFLEYTSRAKPDSVRPVTVPAAQPRFSSNEGPDSTPSQGRLIFLAVDQGSFKPLGAHGAMEAARRFIDRLQPADRVGLVAFPPPGPSVGASRDHAAARAATAQIIGSAVPFSTRLSQRNVSLSEAIDIHAGDSMTMERVMARECSWARSGSDRQACEQEVRMEAVDIGRTAEIQANRSLAGIEGVINGLARIKERKTLVLISAGLPVADRMGMDLQLTATVASLGRDAAAANLNLFVLHIDSGFLDAFSAEQRTMSDTLSRDLGIMSGGLETISGASGGSLARVVAGADFAFDRVLRETAAAYVLGVEPAATDRDGKTHRINVKVRATGAEVRSRREVLLPVADTKPATPEDALASAFRSSRRATGLRLRVATACMAAAAGGHRVFISADIGQGIVGPAEMRLLYAITDASGRTSSPVEQKQTLTPRPGDASGSVSYTFQDVLRPGSYALRLAAADSTGLAGSVDHTFTVGLTKGDGVRLSDLLLLEPGRDQQDQVDVIIDGQLRDETVDAYLEIAPATQSAAKPDVAFGVADRPDGTPLVSAPALVSRTAGAEHWSAAARLNLALLPPGDYVATAVVSAGERMLGRVARPVRVERAAPPAGGAAPGAARAPRVSFAAGESGSLVRRFSPQDVLSRDSIDYFAGRLRAASPATAGTPETASAVASLEEGKYDDAFASLASADQTVLPTLFLRGLALLGKGELEPASVQFRASLDIAPDFLPAAFYLGACYAGGGNDREAVGAWQTALITESDARIIYDVLGDALLRLNEGDEAARLLTEARDKWADDDRFVPRLAASEALRRNPKEAMALLDGYIARHPEDANALLLALRLLYDARSGGTRIASAAEDAASARRYAELYKAAGGSKASLVDRWVAYIAAK